MKRVGSLGSPDPGQAAEAALRSAVEAWISKETGRGYRWSELDELALVDIARVQCFGRTKKALEFVREVLTTPGLFGSGFARRYVSFLAWTDDGRPVPPRKTHPARLPRYRAMIVSNAQVARRSA